MLSNIRFACCAVVALQSRNGAIAGMETDNGETTFCSSALVCGVVHQYWWIAADPSRRGRSPDLPGM